MHCIDFNKDNIKLSTENNWIAPIDDSRLELDTDLMCIKSFHILGGTNADYKIKVTSQCKHNSCKQFRNSIKKLHNHFGITFNNKFVFNFHKVFQCWTKQKNSHKYECGIYTFGDLMEMKYKFSDIQLKFSITKKICEQNFLQNSIAKYLLIREWFIIHCYPIDLVQTIFVLISKLPTYELYLKPNRIVFHYK